MSWVSDAIEALRNGKDVIVRPRGGGNVLLHLVKELDGERVLIGNNLGKLNGWAMRTDVLGRVLAVHAQ